MMEGEPLNLASLAGRVESRTGDTVCGLKYLTIGGSHRLYWTTMLEAGGRLLRVNYPWGVDRGLGTTPANKLPSEVATLEFLRLHTTVPVPRVFCYDADEDNAVGGPWMLMEYIHGQPLSMHIFGMTPDQQLDLVTSIAQIQAELLGLRFNAIGSLCKSDGGNIVVGPLTSMPSRSSADFAPPNIDRCGPFNSAREWLAALARGELAFKSTYPVFDGRRDAVTQTIYEQTSSISAEDEKFFEICLDHVDFYMHNILVDPQYPTRILAVIDWEGARTVPLFAVEPAFLRDIKSERGFHEPRAAANRFMDVLGKHAPSWRDAMGELGRHLRRLHALARTSTWSEVDLGDTLDLPPWWGGLL